MSIGQAVRCGFLMRWGIRCERPPGHDGRHEAAHLLHEPEPAAPPPAPDPGKFFAAAAPTRTLVDPPAPTDWTVHLATEDEQRNYCNGQPWRPAPQSAKRLAFCEDCRLKKLHD